MGESVTSSFTCRPRWLIALAALLALLQTGAVWWALRVPDDAATLVGLPPAANAALSAGWALAFAWLVVRLMRRRPRGRLYAAALVGGFALYSLARLALFAQADYDRQRLPLLAAVTSVIVIILAAYAARSRLVDSTEKELNGCKPQD